MAFLSDKQQALQREDRSVKGSIDSHIKDLCDFINSMPNFYTTSSCSGRIVLTKVPDSGKKNEFEWILVSHDTMGFYNLKAELSTLPKEEVWFRFEPFIIHVVADSVVNAGRILSIAQQLGIKRSGIISLAEAKVVIEIIGNQCIDTMIAKDGAILVTDNYLSMLLDKANSKMERNHKTIENLYDAIKGL